MSPRFLALPCLVVLCAAACGGSATKTDAPAAAAAPAAASMSGTPEFGVKECDEYIAKYSACVSAKAPEASRAAMAQALDQSKAAWKAAASTPEGRQSLAAMCTQALTAAKTSMQVYGCEW